MIDPFIAGCSLVILGFNLGRLMTYDFFEQYVETLKYGHQVLENELRIKYETDNPFAGSGLSDDWYEWPYWLIDNFCKELKLAGHQHPFPIELLPRSFKNWPDWAQNAFKQKHQV